MLGEWTVRIASVLIKFLVDFYLKHLGPQHCIDESHSLRRTVAGVGQHMLFWSSGESQHKEPTQLG